MKPHNELTMEKRWAPRHDQINESWLFNATGAFVRASTPGGAFSDNIRMRVASFHHIFGKRGRELGRTAAMHLCGWNIGMNIGMNIGVSMYKCVGTECETKVTRKISP